MPKGRFWVWAPEQISWWIAVLFIVGSALFATGSLPAFSELAGTARTAWTFFRGSIFFTSAAYLQFVEAVNAGRHSGGLVPWRWTAWLPGRIDWWATAVQLVGTLAFNVNTGAALVSGLSVAAQEEWIWTPDAFGAVCFLVSSYLAWAEVCHAAFSLRVRDISWWIVWINLLGSVAFGVAAAGAFILPAGGQLWSERCAVVGTGLGALCFLVAAWLMFPEIVREHMKSRSLIVGASRG